MHGRLRLTQTACMAGRGRRACLRRRSPMRGVLHLSGAAQQFTLPASVDSFMSLLIVVPQMGRELISMEAKNKTTKRRAHHADVCDGSSLTKRQMRRVFPMPTDDRFAIHWLPDQCASSAMGVDAASDFIMAPIAPGTQLDAIIPFVNFGSDISSLSITQAREAMNSISCV